MKLHKKSVEWLKQDTAPRMNTPAKKLEKRWKRLYPDLDWFVPKNKPCDGCGKVVPEDYLCQPCADKLFASWIRGWEPRSLLQSSFPETSVFVNRAKAKKDYAGRKKVRESQQPCPPHQSHSSEEC